MFQANYVLTVFNNYSVLHENLVCMYLCVIIGKPGVMRSPFKTANIVDWSIDNVLLALDRSLEWKNDKCVIRTLF